MSKPRFAALVLSAGFSSRMLEFKPLLEINGQSLVERAVSIFIKNNVDVFLVTGYRGEEIRQQLPGSNLKIVENPDYASGMFSSVQAGVRGLGQDYAGFFMLPVDIPMVRPYTIRRLIEQTTAHPEKILYPVFRGRRGHPPFIPSVLIPSILDFGGEGGLKGALSRFENEAVEVPVPDEYIHFDADTTEQYENLKELVVNYDIPTPGECEILLDIFDVEPKRRNHSYRVAEVGVKIGRALVKKGIEVDIDLIESAAVLHDIAKKERFHDVVGGRWLYDMGFTRPAEIVAVHTFLPEKAPDYSLETKIVYLADKLVQSDRVVTLEERYRGSMERYGINPDIAEKIIVRKQRSYQIKKELEELTGRPLEEIIDEL